MKTFHLLAFFCLFLLSSCQKDNTFDLRCLDDFRITSDFSEDEVISFVPNIIVTGDSDYGKFNIAAYQATSIIYIKETPISLQLEIRDSNDEILFRRSDIEAFDTYSFALWDGLIDGVAYEGIVNFELLVFFDSLKKILYTGSVPVVSCETVQECLDNNKNCDLEFCNYYGNFLQNVLKIPSESCF